MSAWRWNLEIARMAMYIAFPVAIFHWFNQPENFEEWVIKTRREYYPPEKKEDREMWQNFIREFNEKKDQEELLAMEAAQKKFEDLEAKKKSLK